MKFILPEIIVITNFGDQTIKKEFPRERCTVSQLAPNNDKHYAIEIELENGYEISVGFLIYDGKLMQGASSLASLGAPDNASWVLDYVSIEGIQILSE